MAKVRGVRFTDQEEKMINEFLKKNTIFDFSTLAKIAIISFIQSPNFEIKAVKNKKNIAEHRSNNAAGL